MPTQIYIAVYDKLVADYPSALSGERTERITNHYQREVDLNRIDPVTAIDRCIGDICGRNYGPMEQRSTPKAEY